MHYPHLHRSSGQGVAYGHYEEPPLQIRKSRLPVDMQGHEYKLSGYRLVHWDPTLKPPKGQNHMDLATRHTALTVAAVLSYYTARSIRLDNESSKLLLLTPHNDSVVDLQDALGLPAPNYPPTLYDFYLTILYKQHFLPSNLAKFPRRDHNDTPMEIYNHIQAHAEELVPQLEAFATLRAIVEIVHTCPKGFASYCTISNTVKAIGIGGSASLFASVKMSSFLASTQEAEARNLVALTRSKGLCLLLLPSTHEHTESPLHTIRTMCALRHGLFHIGKDSVDLDAFAAFLSQPDTVDFAHDGITIDGSAPFSLDSWLFTHQISYFGKWDFLPLALRLTFRTTPFILKLSLRQEVPRANTFLATPDLFYWQGHLLDGIRVTLNFGVNCLELASEHFIYARFNYPAPGLTPPLLEDNGCRVEVGPAQCVWLAINRHTQELGEKATNGGDRHVKTVFHCERWKLQGFRQGVFTGKEGEPNLVKFVCGMARPELRAKEKGKHDTGKAGDQSPFVLLEVPHRRGLCDPWWM